MTPVRLAVASDFHYAGPRERSRGNDYEYGDLAHPLVKHLLRLHRRHVWLRDPLAHGHLLADFLNAAAGADHVVINGDYSCDSAFIGVSDDAAFESAKMCLDAIRGRFPGRAEFVFGDHELGKLSLGGAKGGMRVASFERAVTGLGLKPFWRRDIGRYTLLGVVSTLVGLPVFTRDALTGELAEWHRLRAAHLALIRQEFQTLPSDRRVLLFCHDPTALPFLWREEAVRARLAQVEQTFIGHLHSPLILWQSRLLAGMPTITRLGPTVHRLTQALNQARHWRPFRVRLCPAVAGIELLKDGGFLWVRLDPNGRLPLSIERQKLPRRASPPSA